MKADCELKINENKQLLEELHEGIKICTACPLHKSRNRAVPGEGSYNAQLMLIGEAPGEKEDESGRPFSGRAGYFLNQLYNEIGWNRNNSFITSTVKCRPPANRKPSSKEMETCCKLWLSRQIDLVKPEIVVLLGKTPIRQILQEETSLRFLHGKVRELNGRKFVPTYHPAAAMRFPEPKKGIKEDFQLINDMLKRR